MARFNLPTANAVSSFFINELGGVDYWSSPDNVSKHRSPYCVNMIRDKMGSLRKRMGYEKLYAEPFGARINGGCFFSGKQYIHAGTKIYRINEDGSIFDHLITVPDKKSVFITTLEKLYFLSGESIYYFTTRGSYGRIAANTYVPTVIVSKSPSGGGVEYEKYNLISPYWKEQFLADGESTVYHLEKKNIVTVISVKIRDDNGDLTEVDDDLYDVSYADGTITFSTPPAKPSVVGMDNVFVEVLKSEGTENMIYGCTVGAFFGASGKNDRLFLGGNPEYPGMDFYSAAGDFTYFPAMNYSKLSQGQIKGYSVFNGSLYTHLCEESVSGKSSIIKRDGTIDGNGDEAFVITGEFSSQPFVSSNTSLLLNGEALFLSKNGIYGVTISDVTEQQICELRSAYLGDTFSQFTDEEKSDAHAIISGDYYMLSIGNKMFILDGACKSYFSGTPLCSFQYECYCWENIPSRALWTDGKNIYFGSENGYVYRFFTEKNNAESYTDDGEAVACYFDTACIDDRTFFKKKTYVSVSAKIKAFLKTGVKIYAKTDGRWHNEPIYESRGRGQYFDFSFVDFESFSFSSNRGEVTLFGKTRIRNIDAISFRIVNDKAEPFVLYAFGAEYVQKGNYIK